MTWLRACSYVDPTGKPCALQDHPDIRVHIVNAGGCWAIRVDHDEKWTNARLDNAELNRADAPAALHPDLVAPQNADAKTIIEQVRRKLEDDKRRRRGIWR